MANALQGRLVVVQQLTEVETDEDPNRLDRFVLDIETVAPPATGNTDEARRLNGVALAAIRDSRYDEAVALLEQAVVADPADVEVAGNLADSLMRAGRLPDALRAAEGALALGPRRASGWGSLGLIYSKLDRPEVAVGCLVAGHRVASEPAQTERVYSRLAQTDGDPKVRAVMQQPVARLASSQ